MSYIVEHSDDGNQVCVIPNPSISLKEFSTLMKMFVKLGYKWWLPADKRCGYILSKKQED